MLDRPPVRRLPYLALPLLLALAALLATSGYPPGNGGRVSAAGLVTNLSVSDGANAGDWSIQPALATGTVQYGDRAYTFSSVPAGLAGSEWIRTANDSKAFTGATLASFTVSADADVYVALNDSISTRPAWLGSGWSDTGAHLVNNEGSPKTFSLFRRSFAAGAMVALGSNGSTSASMYTIVVASATGPTPSPLPSSPPDASGRPVLPPKWAFGTLFGSYYDQALVLDAMRRLRSDGYGGDLMWVDSSWLSSEYNDPPKYIRFRFDGGQFPDPKGMIDTLRANHFHFGVWEWPFIDISITDLYNFGRSHGYFIKSGGGDVVDGGGWHGVTFTGQFDFTNPGARAWWKTVNQPLVEMGVEFFKIDTHSTVPSGGRLSDGSGTDNLRKLYHKTVHEVSQAASGGRGFILTHRPATSDNLLYPGMWTGDTSASWSGFEEEMNRASKMNTERTAAFWGGDTGGYNSNPSDELYIRWLQYGAFTPINEFFASKGSKTRFPWKFGAQAQQIFKTYMRLRYRLLPFRYSNAQAAFHETPIKWPVRFVSGRTDELIVGNGSSELLVAPIHTQGATSGQAHLPAGKAWIDYWTGAVHAGGTAPTVAAPLERVPLFVKAGSIIPMGPDLEWVDQKPADPLTLDIYPSGRSSYTLYEDDGASNDYKSGAVSKTTFTCDDNGGVQVSIGASSGSYQGKLAARTYVLKINGQAGDPGAVQRDGEPLERRSSLSALMAAEDGWFHDAAADVVWVKFRIDTDSATTVTL